MKKILLSLFFVIFAVSAYATDFRYLVLQSSDGAETFVAISGVKMSFESGTLTVTNDEGGKWQFTVNKLSKFYFTDKEDTAVEQVFSGSEDGLTAVYDIDGKCVGKFHSKMEMENALRSGVYIIKSNGVVAKKVVK